VPGKHPRLCVSCGQTVRRSDGPEQAGARLVCRNAWCASGRRPLDAVYAIGNYEGALRRAIVAYKYKGDLRWVRPFAMMLVGFLERHANWFEQYGVICPVPSFRGPGARRDFGHVELLCSELATLAGPAWPVERLVSKKMETPPMSVKTQSERRRSGRTVLRRAMTVPVGTVVDGSRILVVDDVCASGETLLAVAGALKAAGACEVSGLVLARASWHDPLISLRR